MTPQRIAILRKQLAQLEAERADRVRRGANVPVWFDHMLEKRRAQLRDAERPAVLHQIQRNNRVSLAAIVVAIACVVAMIAIKVVAQ